MKTENGTLIHGDNLDNLKFLAINGYKNKIDLIYIDPPFGIGKNFIDKSGNYYSDKVCGLEYLKFLEERLEILKDLLNEKGSIYVHCDHRNSHKIKILLDEIFGESNFKNEIIWENQGSWIENYDHYPRRHSSIFFYTKSEKYAFNKQTEEDVNSGVNFNRWYRYIENNKIYADNAPYQDSRFTAYINKFEKTYKRKPIGKDVIVEFKGSLVGSVWYIKSVDPKSAECVEYPTQKPEALLERIIKTSSNESDTILDCFAGSGTTLAVAQRLNRKWIGIDSNLQSIEVIKKRFKDKFNIE